MSSFDSVGNLFVAVLGSDACSKAVIVDQKGATRGRPFAGGRHITLDDARLVIAPCGSHTLSVIEAVKGAVASTLELPAEADGASIARVDGHTVALLWSGHLAWVHFPDGQPPVLGKTITIPRCPGP